MEMVPLIVVTHHAVLKKLRVMNRVIVQQMNFVVTITETEIVSVKELHVRVVVILMMIIAVMIMMMVSMITGV